MISSENDRLTRWDIETALRHYAYGLDERRWEAWDLAFAPGAIIDFTPMGANGKGRARCGSA